MGSSLAACLSSPHDILQTMHISDMALSWLSQCCSLKLVMQEVTDALSSHLKSAEVLRQQACIRPLSPDGTPIIGQHPYVAGAYIATGRLPRLI